MNINQQKQINNLKEALKRPTNSRMRERQLLRIEAYTNMNEEQWLEEEEKINTRKIAFAPEASRLAKEVMSNNK